MNGYEQFKYENSVIRSIYTVAGSSDDDSKKPANEREAKILMMQNIAQQNEYRYSYVDRMLDSILVLFRCCCKDKTWFKKRVAKLERHNSAADKLTNEFDIVELTQNVRLGKFLSKLMLKRH